MRNIKKISGYVFGLVVVYFLFSQLSSKEETLVVLRCVRLGADNKEEKDSDAHYKITKRYFDDQPYKLYISSPDFDEKDSPPLALGILYENANNSDKENLKSRLHFSPDWYTFIPEFKKGKFFIPDAIYVNRATLQMEDTSLDDGKLWSTRNCSIVEQRSFDDEWESKVKNKKKELKF